MTGGRLLGSGGLLLVVLLCLVVAVSTPSEARAWGNPSDPFTQLKTGTADSGLRAWFKGLLSGKGTAALEYGTLMGGESTATKVQADSALYRARVGARFLPRLGLVATRLSLIGTAGYIGWRVYQHYNGEDETIDLFIDSDTLGADALLNPAAVWGANLESLTWDAAKGAYAEWRNHSGSDCAGTGASDCFILYLNPASWDSFFGGRGYKNQPFPSEVFRNTPDWDQCQAAFGYGMNNGYCAQYDYYPFRDGNWGSQLAYMIDRTVENLDDRIFGGYVVTHTQTTVDVGGTPIDFHQLKIPRTALGPSAGVTTGTMGTPDVTTDYNAPSDAGDAPSPSSPPPGIDEFDTPCGRALIRHLRDPDNYVWPADCFSSPSEPLPLFVDLPAPYETGESFNAYRERLLEAGFSGTITRKVQTGEILYPSLPNGAVVKVVTGEELWETIDWPFPLPRIEGDTDLEVYVNPGTYVGGAPGSATSYPLPQPRPDETAGQYRQRLRDLGHMGSIVIEEAEPGDMPDPESPVKFNPNEPVEIRIGSPATTTVRLMDPWPREAPPVIATDTPIIIIKAPPTTPTRTGTDEPPPGYVDDPEGGGYTCTCPPIDFGPLTEVGTTSKFPFGVFSWVSGIFGGLEGAAAPSMTASTPIGPVAFDLAAADDNVAIVRTYTDPVFKFIIVLGSVWYLATGVIGLGKGGIEADD